MWLTIYMQHSNTYKMKYNAILTKELYEELSLIVLNWRYGDINNLSLQTPLKIESCLLQS